MTDHTEQPTTTTAAARTDQQKLASVLFWIGPSCFMAAVAIGMFASTQYNGTALAIVAGVLALFGGLSILLWLAVKVLSKGK